MSYKINRSNGIITYLVLIIAFSFVLSSCGNKGPLTLPKKQIEQVTEQESPTNNN